MDFFSGSVPRKLIPFHLGMSADPKESSTSELKTSENAVSVASSALRPNDSPITPSTKELNSPLTSGTSSSDVTTYVEGFMSKANTAPADSEATIVINRPKTPDSTQVTIVHPITSKSPGSQSDNSPTKGLMEATSEDPCHTEKPPQSQLLPDSESEVASLFECNVFPTTVYPQTDISEAGEVQTGEPSTKVLYKDANPGVNFVVPQNSDVDADLSGNDGELGEPRLNSMDPLPGIRHLTGQSRGILKEYFERNVPIELPRDHPTIALSEDQTYHLLRVMSYETAHTSFDLFRGLLNNPSNSSGRWASSGTRGKSSSRRLRSSTPARRDLNSTTEDERGEVDRDDLEVEGYTSGFVHTGDSDVTSDRSTVKGNSSTTLLPTSSTPKRSTSSFSGETENRSLPLGARHEETVDTTPSSLDQPLSTLIASSSRTFDITETPPKETRSIAVGDPPPKTRRGVSRPGKIFKEAYFHKIEWTRTFVSGPMDPLDNPYSFYCQICQCNVSIYGKGAAEVRRHYGSRRHFRRDQKWRYVHLAKTDPVTGETTHAVRDKSGKLLNKLELELELPHFENEELIEVGDKFPFYEDVAKGGDAQITSQSRARTQLCLLGDYLRTGGDIGQLRSIWANVGTFTNHQGLFADFDWSDERLSVSCFHIIYELL